MERDIEANPYSVQEQRVADYITELTGGAIGAGDDPVGFLIGSHAMLSGHIQEMAEFLREKGLQDEFLKLQFTAAQPAASPAEQTPE